MPKTGSWRPDRAMPRPAQLRRREPTLGFEGFGVKVSSGGLRSRSARGRCPALGGLLVGAQHLAGALDGGAGVVEGVFFAAQGGLARTFLMPAKPQGPCEIEPPAITPVPGAARPIHHAAAPSSPRLSVGIELVRVRGHLGPDAFGLIRPPPCGGHRSTSPALPTPDHRTGRARCDDDDRPEAHSSYRL